MPLYLWHVKIFGIPTNVFELVMLFSLVWWLSESKKTLLNQYRNIPRNIKLSIALILLGITTSLIANGVSTNGLGILKSWFLIPIAFSFAIFTQTRSGNDARKVLSAICFSVFCVSLISVYYKLTGQVTFDGRLQGFYSSPNYLSMFLAPGILIGIYFLIDSLKRKLSLINLLLAFLLLPIIVSLYFTYSYSSWLALFSSVPIVFLPQISKNKRLLAAAGLTLVLAIAIFLQSGTQKFSNLLHVSQRSSIASRVIIWTSAGLMIHNHPIFGIGPGNFQNIYLGYQKYFPPYLEWAVPEPHNIFLAFWLQTGLLGLFGFILLLVNLFQILKKVLRNEKSAGMSALLLSFFVYVIINGLFDTPYWKNDLSFLFWIFVFLTLSLTKIESSNADLGKIL